jgi:hypothetical protein
MTAPKSHSFDTGLYSDSGRLDAFAFSACANDNSGFLSVYGGLVPLGFSPFQFACIRNMHFHYLITQVNF